MRGLTPFERHCLAISFPESDAKLTLEEGLCCVELVKRGLLRTWDDWDYDPDDGKEWEYEYFEITSLGRLALTVCLPEIVNTDVS